MSADGDRERVEASRLIGRAIRRLRERVGLTQAQCAYDAGISYQYLCGIETGKENFSIRVLERLAKALNVSIVTIVSLAYGEAAEIGFARPLLPLGPVPG